MHTERAISFIIMIHREAPEILVALHDLQTEGQCPTLMRLIHRTGLAPEQIGQAVDELADRDFVDPVRLRLTMLGLAAARALRAQKRLIATHAA